MDTHVCSLLLVLMAAAWCQSSLAQQPQDQHQPPLTTTEHPDMTTTTMLPDDWPTRQSRQLGQQQDDARTDSPEASTLPEDMQLQATTVSARPENTTFLQPGAHGLNKAETKAAVDEHADDKEQKEAVDAKESKMEPISKKQVATSIKSDSKTKKEVNEEQEDLEVHMAKNSQEGLLQQPETTTIDMANLSEEVEDGQATTVASAVSRKGEDSSSRESRAEDEILVGQTLTLEDERTPKMTVEPSMIYFFKSNEPFVLVCDAESDSGPVSYSWLKNGRPYDLDAGGWQVFRESPFNGNLAFVQPKPDDVGTYQCVAENAFGKTFSQPSLVMMRRPVGHQARGLSLFNGRQAPLSAVHLVDAAADQQTRQDVFVVLPDQD